MRLAASLIAAFTLLIAAPAHAGTLIVANLKGHSISLIDSESGKTKRVPIGPGKTYPAAPILIGDSVFVTLHNYDAAQAGHFLYELDLKTKTGRLLLPYSDRQLMATNGKYDQGKLLVTDEAGANKPGNLVAIDLGLLERFPSDDMNRNPAVRFIPVGNTPAGLAIAPDTHKAYVANRYSGSLSVINLEAMKETSRMVITKARGNTLYDVVLGERGELFCSALGINGVYQVTSDGDVIELQGNFNYPAGISFAKKSRRLFVPNFRENTVSVIDVATRREIAKVPVGNQPVESALDDTESRLFVSNYTDGTVSVIDLNTLIQTKVFATDQMPLGILYTPRILDW